MTTRRAIAVIGPGEASASEMTMAEEVGRLLAERGAIVLCGGLGGVMEAVCRGAALAGGMTIGILPGSEPAQGNPHLQLALPTGLGEARNVVLVTAASAVLAIGGGFGTLSEIGLALKRGRPVIGLRTWGLERPGGGEVGIRRADDPLTAVNLVMESVKA